MEKSIQEHIASLRNQLESDYRERKDALERAFREKKKLIDQLERSWDAEVQPPESPTDAAPPDSAAKSTNGDQISVTAAVKRVLRKDRAMDNAAITEAIKPLNPKMPKSKTLSRAVAASVYKLRVDGKIIATKDKKYRLP